MILSFFERQFHSLSYTSTTLEVSAHWCDGLLLWWRSFGFTWKESKIHHTRSNVLFVFFSRRTKCRVVCVCVSVRVWVVYLCIGIITIHSNEMLSFSNALSRIHRELTRSRSLSHSFAHAHIHARRYSVGIMFILFLVLKISRSFLEKAFFPSSFGRCNL